MEKIRNGKFSDAEWEKFVLTMQDLSNLPLYFDDTGDISIAQIAARAPRRMKREKNIGCVMIDASAAGFPLIGLRRKSRSRNPTEITKNLKVLAKGLDVPVVALSQLFRVPSMRAMTSARSCQTFANPALDRAGRRRRDVRLSAKVLTLKSREPDPAIDPNTSKWMEKLERAHQQSRSAGGKAPSRRHTTRSTSSSDDRYTRFQQPPPPPGSAGRALKMAAGPPPSRGPPPPPFSLFPGGGPPPPPPKKKKKKNDPIFYWARGWGGRLSLEERCPYSFKALSAVMRALGVGPPVPVAFTIAVDAHPARLSRPNHGKHWCWRSRSSTR